MWPVVLSLLADFRVSICLGRDVVRLVGLNSTKIYHRRPSPWPRRLTTRRQRDISSLYR